MRTRIIRGALAVAGAAALLTACGGGGSSSDIIPPTSLVPPEASQSVANFIFYIQELVASSADTLEPVDISQVSPPVDNTGEPVNVN